MPTAKAEFSLVISLAKRAPLPLYQRAMLTNFSGGETTFVQARNT